MIVEQALVQLKLAATMFEKSLKNSRAARCYEQLAEYFKLRKDYHNSLDYYQKAIDLYGAEDDRREFYLRMELIEICCLAENYQKTIEEADHVLKHITEDSVFTYNSGRICLYSCVALIALENWDEFLAKCYEYETNISKFANGAENKILKVIVSHIQEQSSAEEFKAALDRALLVTNTPPWIVNLINAKVIKKLETVDLT